MIKLDRDLLLHLTDVANERNIYIHPNALARHIFWDRLRLLDVVIRKYADATAPILDFGGGSGVFAPTLAAFFSQVDIVDQDGTDAQRIAQHGNLANVNVITSDVHDYQPAVPYLSMVAADVLEHFSDLQRVITTVRRLIADGGHLFVSLPTENWLYCVGRKLVRKQKPADHYHDAETVLSHLESCGFMRLEKCHAPRIGVAFPLFTIAALQKIA